MIDRSITTGLASFNNQSILKYSSENLLICPSIAPKTISTEQESHMNLGNVMDSHSFQSLLDEWS